MIVKIHLRASLVASLSLATLMENCNSFLKRMGQNIIVR